MNPLHIPPFVLTLLQRLRGAGFLAYIVGGAIRDSLLRRSLIDWDIATSADADTIQFLFRDSRQFMLKHQTVTLVHEGKHYEVTPFKGIDRGSSIEQDLWHRDFTINAMAYDEVEDRILDPYGGQEDLTRSLIRATGEPKTRFIEDPLRLLRGIRIAFELHFDIETRTLKAITNLSDKLSTVSLERVRDELIKIVSGDKPSLAFQMLQQTGLLQVIFPELSEETIRKFSFHSDLDYSLKMMDQVAPEPILRLAALFYAFGRRSKRKGDESLSEREERRLALVHGIWDRLRLSNEEKERLLHLIRLQEVVYDSDWSEADVRRLLRRVGKKYISDWMVLRKADLQTSGATSKANLFLELERRIDEVRQKGPSVFSVDDLEIGGEEVMAVLEIQPGPKVGTMLQQLLEEVIEDPHLNTRSRLMDRLKDLKAQS